MDLDILYMLDEGSTCYVYVSGEHVQKVLKRRCHKHSLSAEEQFVVHSIAYEIVRDFKLLIVPRPISHDKKSYLMERINTEEPVFVCEEIPLFVEKMRNKGYEPYDYELYLQPNGRIAMIDFGSFLSTKYHFAKKLYKK